MSQKLKISVWYSGENWEKVRGLDFFFFRRKLLTYMMAHIMRHMFAIYIGTLTGYMLMPLCILCNFLLWEKWLWRFVFYVFSSRIIYFHSLTSRSTWEGEADRHKWHKCSQDWLCLWSVVMCKQSWTFHYFCVQNREFHMWSTVHMAQL